MDNISVKTQLQAMRGDLIRIATSEFEIPISEWKSLLEDVIWFALRAGMSREEIKSCVYKDREQVVSDLKQSCRKSR